MSGDLAFDHGTVGARILWRHWLKDRSEERREGCVQAFSPSGDHVRISDFALPVGAGTWFERKTIRVMEVLELCYVQRIEAEEKARLAREAQARARRRKRGGDQEGDAV